jgi:hypothetical protein
MDEVTAFPGWVVEDRVTPHPVVHRLQTTKHQLWVGGDPPRRRHASASILRSSDPVRKTVSKSGRRRIEAGRRPDVTRHGPYIIIDPPTFTESGTFCNTIGW